MAWLTCHRSAASDIDERDDLGNREIAICGNFQLIG